MTGQGVMAITAVSVGSRNGTTGSGAPRHLARGVVAPLAPIPLPVDESKAWMARGARNHPRGGAPRELGRSSRPRSFALGTLLREGHAHHCRGRPTKR